jgi:putative sugar O-methyltransferase
MIEDRPEYLEEMIQDMKNANKLYQTTNYWKNYEKVLLPYIYSHGIKDFRSSNKPIMPSFGGGGNPVFFPENNIKKALLYLLLKLEMILNNNNNFANIAKQCYLNWEKECYKSAKLLDDENELKKLYDSGEGKPSNIFSIDGTPYTPQIFSKFLYYLYIKRHFNFSRENVIIFEIGPGVGYQAEVFLKLHPHLRILLLDIPPQLYIAQQYLSAVFPDKVQPYNVSKKYEILDESIFENKNIVMLAPWQIEKLNINSHLFWNSASFQEMEPDVVDNYLSFVNKSTLEVVYLMELMSGKETAKSVGEHGVLEQVKYEHYKKGLSCFDNMVLEPNIILQQDGYFHSIWKRKNGK